MSQNSESNSALTRFWRSLARCSRVGFSLFSSKVRCDIFPFMRWCGILITTLRRLSVAFSSAKCTIYFKAATQFTTSKNNSWSACQSLSWIFCLSVRFAMYALAMTLSWSNCSLIVFRTVSYIIPCDPIPFIVRLVFPVTCIFNFAILTSTDRCSSSCICILKRSINLTCLGGSPSYVINFMFGIFIEGFRDRHFWKLSTLNCLFNFA